jgi:hypothetical protein
MSAQIITALRQRAQQLREEAAALNNGRQAWKRDIADEFSRVADLAESIEPLLPDPVQPDPLEAQLERRRQVLVREIGDHKHHPDTGKVLR